MQLSATTSIALSNTFDRDRIWINGKLVLLYVMSPWVDLFLHFIGRNQSAIQD